MAKKGIDKKAVRRAVNSLISAGNLPSIDQVLDALGVDEVDEQTELLIMGIIDQRATSARVDAREQKLAGVPPVEMDPLEEIILDEKIFEEEEETELNSAATAVQVENVEEGQALGEPESSVVPPPIPLAEKAEEESEEEVIDLEASVLGETQEADAETISSAETEHESIVTSAEEVEEESPFVGPKLSDEAAAFSQALADLFAKVDRANDLAQKLRESEAEAARLALQVAWQQAAAKRVQEALDAKRISRRRRLLKIGAAAAVLVLLAWPFLPSGEQAANQSAEQSAAEQPDTLPEEMSASSTSAVEVVEAEDVPQGTPVVAPEIKLSGEVLNFASAIFFRNPVTQEGVRAGKWRVYHAYRSEIPAVRTGEGLRQFITSRDFSPTGTGTAYALGVYIPKDNQNLIAWFLGKNTLEELPPNLDELAPLSPAVAKNGDALRCIPFQVEVDGQWVVNPNLDLDRLAQAIDQIIAKIATHPEVKMEDFFRPDEVAVATSN